MIITAQKFAKSMGCEPQDDDLERCNCQLAGRCGHYACGWDARLDRAKFACNPRGWMGTAELIAE